MGGQGGVRVLEEEDNRKMKGTKGGRVGERCI